MDNETKTVHRAIAGIIICVFLLAIAGSAMLLLRYYPVRYLQTVKKYAAEYDLEPAFVMAVINAESRFNDKAVSGAGASGLMQIMEDTANWIAPMAGLPDFDYKQIFEPEINIRLGCFYLSMYKERFGTLETALCAYNAGGGRVEGWLADSAYSSDGVTLDSIPYSETRNYVERVTGYTRVYDAILRFL